MLGTVMFKRPNPPERHMKGRAHRKVDIAFDVRGRCFNFFVHGGCQCSIGSLQ